MIVIGLLGAVGAANAQAPGLKRGSVFYLPETIDRAKANARKYAWAEEIQQRVVAAAQPWMKMSDDDLWALMFGNTIKRAWMVWSDGHCPSCQESVPMYNWQMDAFAHPWKVRCPHCGELFPKNDFYSFYRSGLDEHDVFDPGLADRSLLFNAEHPDPDDPLHLYGVDDGEGYVEGDQRWRFIGAYLIYGQWRQLITNGIANLAAAYVVTGDRAYAHKAGVLLDRVADLYPTFDYNREGVLYDGRSTGAGYVTVWHDACEETRHLAFAYDQVFDALRDDEELRSFLAGKARQFGLENSKASFADIQRNIEDRILRDAVRNRKKITSNYPRTDFTVATIEAVLGWPDARAQVYAILDGILEKGTAVDGVTGEKGMAGYAASGVRAIVELLAQFSMLDRDLLPEMMQRHPKLRDTLRFYVDTWCLGSYYPLSGDTGYYAQKIDHYVVSPSASASSVTPSGYSVFWRFHELTSDPGLAQVMYQANGNSVEGLPRDLFADDPEAMQRAVQEVIAEHGTTIEVGSVDKKEWHLAILRSGQGEQARALWLDYDSGGGHGHADGMNLGLFAKGLDLMPDFGYPPVQFGGWGSPRARWYTSSAAHNTVVVDGNNTPYGMPPTAGETRLWADGKQFRAVRASGANLIDGQQFARTAALIDISERDCYVLDIFRVVGGSDHAKFMHSHFGEIATQGLALAPVDEYGHGAIMRNYMGDPAPAPGWSVDWDIDDRYHLLTPDSDVHLRYTDLTTGAQAITAEGWLVAGIFNSSVETWIPRIIVRRQSDQAPLASTFVGVIEPYEARSNIAAVCRLPLETADGVACPDSQVAVEVRLADGRRDVIVSADVEGAAPGVADTGALVQRESGLRFDGELCAIRLDAEGNVERLALCNARSVNAGEVSLTLKQPTDFIELSLRGRRARLESGSREAIDSLLLDGDPCQWEQD